MSHVCYYNTDNTLIKCCLCHAVSIRMTCIHHVSCSISDNVSGQCGRTFIHAWCFTSTVLNIRFLTQYFTLLYRAFSPKFSKSPLSHITIFLHSYYHSSFICSFHMCIPSLNKTMLPLLFVFHFIHIFSSLIQHY